MKRISFNEYDAAHIYEMCLEHFCVGEDECCQCSKLKERMEKFIGEDTTKRIVKLIKKQGYCNKLK